MCLNIYTADFIGRQQFLDKTIGRIRFNNVTNQIEGTFLTNEKRVKTLASDTGIKHRVNDRSFLHVSARKKIHV